MPVETHVGVRPRGVQAVQFGNDIQLLLPILGNNDKTKGHPQFEYDDIRYLIVKDDTDRMKLINYIDDKLKSKADKMERTLLKSKILTVRQIVEDF